MRASIARTAAADSAASLRLRYVAVQNRLRHGNDLEGRGVLLAADGAHPVKACRAIIDNLIASHPGRIFNTAGDSVVANFASAVDAVQCVVAVRAAISIENASDIDEPMLFRIGIHVGDVMVDGENLLGDGVNIVARLEALAALGEICLSDGRGAKRYRPASKPRTYVMLFP
jgi:hypothetical protein